MSTANIPAAYAYPFYQGKPGDGVLVVNQLNVADVYVDEAGPDNLMSTDATKTPPSALCTKVAKNGGAVQFTAFSGKLWARSDGAVGPTQIVYLRNSGS